MSASSLTELPSKRPEGEMETLAHHIRQLSDELANERKARQQREERGYSVLDLHVPLGVVFALIIFILTPTAFVIRQYYQMKAHVQNQYIHADETRAYHEGGIAYAKEVADQEMSAHSDLEARDRRIVRLLRDAKWDAKGQKFLFKDPEFQPLRP